MRKEVLWFAEKMEEKLVKNDHKSHWSYEKPKYLIQRLDDEISELKKAIDSGKSDKEIISECADIANFAMMIADIANKPHSCGFFKQE